jgi:hypothetical protein
LLRVILEIPSSASVWISKFSITTCQTQCKLTPSMFESSLLTNSATASATTLPSWKGAITTMGDKMSLLEVWLRDYELNHWDCKPTESQMPERFVDVGSSEGHSVRLVMCTHLDCPVQRYATLSYCWGDDKFSTSKKTKESYSKEIP